MSRLRFQLMSLAAAAAWYVAFIGFLHNQTDEIDVCGRALGWRPATTAAVRPRRLAGQGVGR